MGRHIQVSPNIRMVLNDEEFQRVRKTSKLESILRARGETWVSRLNAELHAAQTARKQPVEDGYAYYIHGEGTRLRMYIVATTARAQAHERKHSSILKLMETTKYDVVERATLNKQTAKKAKAKARKEARDKSRERVAAILAVDEAAHQEATRGLR